MMAVAVRAALAAGPGAEGVGSAFAAARVACRKYVGIVPAVAACRAVGRSFDTAVADTAVLGIDQGQQRVGEAA